MRRARGASAHPEISEVRAAGALVRVVHLAPDRPAKSLARYRTLEYQCSLEQPPPGGVRHAPRILQPTLEVVDSIVWIEGDTEPQVSDRKPSSDPDLSTTAHRDWGGRVSEVMDLACPIGLCQQAPERTAQRGEADTLLRSSYRAFRDGYQLVAEHGDLTATGERLMHEADKYMSQSPYRL